jgi:hypothetical protein
MGPSVDCRIFQCSRSGWWSLRTATAMLETALPPFARRDAEVERYQRQAPFSNRHPPLLFFGSLARGARTTRLPRPVALAGWGQLERQVLEGAPFWHPARWGVGGGWGGCLLLILTTHTVTKAHAPSRKPCLVLLFLVLPLPLSFALCVICPLPFVFRSWPCPCSCLLYLVPRPLPLVICRLLLFLLGLALALVLFSSLVLVYLVLPSLGLSYLVFARRRLSCLALVCLVGPCLG